MNKVINWTFGGFFRAIGRTLAFLLLGFLVGFIAFKSGVKITDLFSFMRVKASTTYTWTTKQSRLYIDQQGTETTTSWETIPHTFSPTYPVSQMQYRLQYSGGLKAGNSYKFKISFLPSPDALNSNGIWFSDGTTTLTEVNCSGWARESNGYYANVCAISPETDISSSGYLYVRIVFNTGYVNTIRSYVGDFEETKGTGAIIQDSAIDIMNNQNENTQAIIDSNMVCENVDKNSIKLDGKYLSNTGAEYSYSDYGITDYYTINSKTKITPTQTISNTANYCYYTETKTVISCSSNSTLTTSNLTIPDNAKYIRFTISKSANKPQFKICKNGNQAIQDSIDDDDVSGANDKAKDLFTNFTTDNHGLTGVITAPLELIRNLASNTCQPLVLPLPFVNENLTLPCLSSIYQQHFPAFLTMYQVIVSALIGYKICISIFFMVKGFKDPGEDKIEVLDL